MAFSGPLAAFAVRPPAPHAVSEAERVLVRLVGGKVLGVRAPGGLGLEDAVAALAANPAVEVAEPDGRFAGAAVPNDPGYAEQWYLDAVRLPEAWNFAKGSSIVKVAILDSGVDLGHPDLRDRIWTNPGERPGNGIDDDGNGYEDDMHGWDFVDDDPDPDPDVVPDGPSEGTNHGTLVAGVIGAAGSNGEGGAGVNWNVRIMPLRVLGSDGGGSTLAVVSAVRYAIASGARVINISFTGSGYSRILADALRDAHRSGIVIVAAAGNEGDTERGGNLNAHPEYPVCYKGVGNEPITIGVSSLGRNGVRSSFSNYGSDCVRLSAPGENIYTTQVYRPGLQGFGAPYGRGWSGSSLAAPVVSGIAALIISMHPGLGPSEVREFLERGAVNVDALNGAQAGHLGAGRVDAASAVLAVQQAILSGGPVRPGAVTRPVAQAPPAAYDGAVAVLAATVAGKPGAAVFGGVMKEHARFEAFGRRSAALPSVAVADTDGDRIPEIVVGAVAGDTPVVRVFNRDGALVAHFLAYAQTYRGGVEVASGDLDGDGRGEIIVGNGPGARPHVRTFDGSGKLLGEFFPFEARDRNGARVAAIDLDGDGRDEIAVAPAGARNEIRVFGADGKQRLSFAPFDRAYRGGTHPAAGDLDGDGRDELVVGAGSGGPPLIAVFAPDGRRRSLFSAFDARLRGGVHVAVLGLDGSADRILAGQGAGGGGLRIMTLEGTVERVFAPFGPRWTGGIRPAAYDLPNGRK